MKGAIVLASIVARIAATTLLLVLVARGSRAALVLLLALICVTLELVILAQGRILRALEDAERVRLYASVLEAGEKLGHEP